MRTHQLTETCKAELPEIDADPPMLEGAGDARSVERSRQLRDRFGLLSPEDLGNLIGVNTRTLAWWRARKQGPDHVRAGRAVYYRRADVEAWLALHVVPMDRAA
jgi:hypothetical protein